MREFDKSFFAKTPTLEVNVGARICVFGEHSDYVPWLTPNIITFSSNEQKMNAKISPRIDDTVKIISTLGEYDDCAFSIQEIRIEGDWLDTLNTLESPPPHWSNYVKGAVAYLDNKLEIEYGFDLLIDSNIPPASGASSSSALTICALAAAHLANNIPWSSEDLAVMGGEAEWYVGTRGGMMDHATMMFAEKGRVLKLELMPFDVKPLPLRLGVRWFTIFTHPADKGGKVRDVFNELVAVQQEIIPTYLGSKTSRVELRQLVETLPYSIEHEQFGLVRVRDRFQFVLNEYDRVQSFISLNENPNLSGITRLLDESWNDTRELLGTHTPEMERIATKIREKNGVLGVKVLGAGFGGNLLICTEKKVDLGPNAVEHTPGKGFDAPHLLLNG